VHSETASPAASTASSTSTVATPLLPLLPSQGEPPLPAPHLATAAATAAAAAAALLVAFFPLTPTPLVGGLPGASLPNSSRSSAWQGSEVHTRCDVMGSATAAAPPELWFTSSPASKATRLLYLQVRYAGLTELARTSAASARSSASAARRRSSMSPEAIETNSSSALWPARCSRNEASACGDRWPRRQEGMWHTRRARASRHLQHAGESARGLHERQAQHVHRAAARELLVSPGVETAPAAPARSHRPDLAAPRRPAAARTRTYLQPHHDQRAVHQKLVRLLCGVRMPCWRYVPVLAAQRAQRRLLRRRQQPRQRYGLSLGRQASRAAAAAAVPRRRGAPGAGRGGACGAYQGCVVVRHVQQDRHCAGGRHHPSAWH
jgi:hypothetical protein